MTAFPVPSDRAIVFTKGAAPPARDEHGLAEMLRSAGARSVVLHATGAWLMSDRRSSEATRRGYVKDLSWWLLYCQTRRINLCDPDPTEADVYAGLLREAGLAPATRARRLSAASSWYRYLVRSRRATINPFEGMDRPRVPEGTRTRGVSADEFDRMLVYAEQHESLRTFAILALESVTALRVGGIINVQLSGLGWDRGDRVIDVPVKGPAGKTKRFILPAFASHALDRYITETRGATPGPLFATASGNPLDQKALNKLIQRVARKAGVEGWEQLSWHSLRHSVATDELDQGTGLHIVQDLLGHADPRTTRRYDEARGNRSPAHQIGQRRALGMERQRSHATSGGDHG